MKKKYLLPELDHDVSIESTDLKDCWDKKDKSYDFLLENLHRDYEPTESVFDGGTSGIPHIYEQMILFSNAFYDPKNPDHDRAVQEWRAVLTLMAFKRIKNLNLDMVKVDLSGNSKNLFIRAATDFVPGDPPVLHQTTWDFLYILLIEDVPIAIMSPTTLVCPAKQFKEKINRCKMPWLRFERVHQQEKLIFKFPEKGHEYSCLTEWLRRLQGKLHKADSTNSDIIHKFEFLTQELASFIDCYAHGKFPESPPAFKEHLYDEMNSSLRDEYGLLNFCCDFEITNKKLKFLTDRYPSDVFQEKILLLVYDDEPDSMFNRTNLAQLGELVDHIMEINQRKIISVIESGGEELPFYALLPFNRQFICELVDRQISPDDFFASYRVEYDKANDRLEVSLFIREFPFFYQKYYERSQWAVVTGRQLLPIYIWPKEQLNKDWSAYYIYAYCDNMDMTIDVPYRESESTQYHPITGGGGIDGAFHIIESKAFPSYLRLVYGQVSGYLPIKTLKPDLQDAGATAQIYLDIGHTNTCIAIVKSSDSTSDSKLDRLDFHHPTSLWVAGNTGKDDGVYYNFLAPCNPHRAREENHSPYFKNMLHDFYVYHRSPESFTVKPFKDGHVVFEKNVGGDVIISIINFNYAALGEHDRKRVHVFLEQILLYAIYEATLSRCAYAEIKFLHRSQGEQLGELKGLWQHALQRVKGQTGIRCWPAHAVACLDEVHALSNYLYLTLVRTGMISPDNAKLPPNKLFVSVDIGWKKTLLTAFQQEDNVENGGIQVKFAEILFAGNDISMVDKEIPFPCYKNLLSLLLSGPYDFDPNTNDGALLNEFGKLYEDDPPDVNYYYGLFDIIALKIEQGNYQISPDIYNNKKEFRCLIKMMTYNILLLFYEIGCILGKVNAKGIEHIQIYLGGNGAKFLNWVVNLKNFREITADNCQELFIAKLQKNILDAVTDGCRINSNNENKTVTCTISVLEKPKEQLIEGYLFHETPELFIGGAVRPQLVYEQFSTVLDTVAEATTFYTTLEQISSGVFGQAFSQQPTSQSGIDMTNAIQMNAKATCGNIIQQICNM